MADFNIIKPSVERIDEPDNLKRIELAGRVCYKSEGKITEGTAEAFCRRILNSGHHSVLEHSNVIVRLPLYVGRGIIRAIHDYTALTHKPGRLNRTARMDSMIISGNVRAWRDILSTIVDRFNFAGHPLLDVGGSGLDLTGYIVSVDSLGIAERQVHDRITLRITCDRGVSHELVRHRVMSFSQESTRYVNYGKRGYTFIEPWWWEDMPRSPMRSLMWNEMKSGVKAYDHLIAEGATPQLARAVLPNMIKTEVVVTATPLEWTDFLRLRTDKAAHPDMRRIADMVRIELGKDIFNFT